MSTTIKVQMYQDDEFSIMNIEEFACMNNEALRDILKWDPARQINYNNEIFTQPRCWSASVGDVYVKPFRKQIHFPYWKGKLYWVSKHWQAYHNVHIYWVSGFVCKCGKKCQHNAFVF